MNHYKWLYLIWFLPAYLLGLCIQQGVVYYSVKDTYKNGHTYIAKVKDYSMQQIATQHNGHVKLNFTTKHGDDISRDMSLPVEMARDVNESNRVPIRYHKGNFNDIVIITAYDTQEGLALSNLAMGAIGFFITVLVAFWVSRYVRRKSRDGEKKMVIERVGNV